jgi:hypothetical protein
MCAAVLGVIAMVVRTEGVLHGGSVELRAPVTELPEGSLVTVELRPRELPLTEKRRLVQELAGSWADDPSLGPIFEKIERKRQADRGRWVDLDDPPARTMR